MFHINHDAPGIRIFSQEVDEITKVNVNHGAKGCDKAEANVRGNAPLQERPSESTALRDKGNISLVCFILDGSCVETHCGSDYAYGVRSHYSHSIPVSDGYDLILKLLTFRAHFAET